MADDQNSTLIEPPADEAGAQARAAVARSLIRGSIHATLATAEGRQPHAALVAQASMADLSIVLLLSDMSRHTAHLRANARCALFYAAPVPTGGLANPQTAYRLSLDCLAALDADPALRARYLALHPYAETYAGFTDFSIWRFRIQKAHIVAGFARAWTMSAAELAPDPALVAALENHEPSVIQHCNSVHSEAMRWIGQAHAGYGAGWRMVGIDADGFDLVGTDARARIAWPRPVRDVDSLRRALVELARRARDRVAA